MNSVNLGKDHCLTKDASKDRRYGTDTHTNVTDQ